MSIRLEKSCSRIVLLMSLIPVTTLFQSLSIFEHINQLLVVLIVIASVPVFVEIRFRIFDWLVLLATIFCVVADLLITGGGLMRINSPIYLPFWVVTIILFINLANHSSRILKDNVGRLETIATIWGLLILISAFMPGSYMSQTGWGSGRYFASFTGNPFRVAPTAFMILCLLTACAIERKGGTWKLLLISCAALYCGFMCGSRTYFVIIAIQEVIFLRYYFYYDSVKFHWSVVVVVLLGMAMFGLSSISSKISSTQYVTGQSYFDFWGTMTNGRSVFWTADLEHYGNYPVWEKIVGGGYNEIYLVNQRVMGIAIWAHNDFINILVTNGVLGIIIYVCPLFSLIKKVFEQKTVPTGILVAFVAIWLVNAMFNMVYTYTCACLATGMFLFFLTAQQSSENGDKRKTMVGV